MGFRRGAYDIPRGFLWGSYGISKGYAISMGFLWDFCVVPMMISLDF